MPDEADMRAGPRASDDPIRGLVLEAFARDQHRDGLREVEAYQALFPGWEGSVARIYDAFTVDAYGGEKGPEPASRAGSEVQDDFSAAGRKIGPYRVLRELGRGGQGIVYLARDTRLDRMAAVKVLRGLGPDAAELLDRFKREAGVAARLHHPGICPIYDAEVTGGMPYIAMRYLEGRSLADRISARRNRSREVQASPKDARTDVLVEVALIEKTARALHAMHEAGVVHRDIKPGNVMITPSGEPVIMDFGLSRDETPDRHALTRSGDLFGTPAYMPPEHLSTERIGGDRRADIWSLGAVLYECVSLHRPFGAPTRERLYQQIIGEEPRPVSRLNPAVSKDLATVIQVALEKSPDRRYQTAEGLADDLARVLQQVPVLARPVSPLGAMLRWSRRRPAAASLFLILLIGVPAISLMSAYLLRNVDKIRAQEAEESRAKVESLLLAAYQELHEEDPRRARELLRSVLAIQPDNVEAIGGIALSWFAEHRPSEALAFLDRNDAVVRRSSGLRAYRARARGEKNTDAVSPSERHEHSTLRASDYFLSGLDKLGFPEHLAPSFAALADLNMAMELTAPRLLYAVHRARAASELGIEEGVRLQYSDALVALWPNSHYAWYGRAMLQRDDLRIRAEALEKALELEPAHRMSRINLASTRRQMGELDSALAAVDVALAAHPSSESAMRIRCECLLDAGVPREALRTIDGALRNSPGSLTLKTLRARCLSALGEVRAAHRLRDEILKGLHELPTAMCRHLAWSITAVPLVSNPPVDAEEVLSSFEFALALAREAVRRSPRPDADVLNCLGIALFRVGIVGEESQRTQRLTESLDHFRQSERACARDGRPLFSSDASFSAMCHHLLGHEAEARTALRQAGTRLEENWSSYVEERATFAEAQRVVGDSP